MLIAALLRFGVLYSIKSSTKCYSPLDICLVWGIVMKLSKFRILAATAVTRKQLPSMRHWMVVSLRHIPGKNELQLSFTNLGKVVSIFLLSRSLNSRLLRGEACKVG